MIAKKAGFRLGVYVFMDAEIVDFAAPHGVFSVARRYDPELDAFLIADANRPVQAQAGFTVLPNYSFADEPYMDAFLIPGGFGPGGRSRPPPRWPGSWSTPRPATSTATTARRRGKAQSG